MNYPTVVLSRVNLEAVEALMHPKMHSILLKYLPNIIIFHWTATSDLYYYFGVIFCVQRMTTRTFDHILRKENILVYLNIALELPKTDITLRTGFEEFPVL